MKRALVTIIVELDYSCTIAEAKQYIIKELAANGGLRHIDDPLFRGLKVKEILMKLIQ